MMNRGMAGGLAALGPAAAMLAMRGGLPGQTPQPQGPAGGNGLSVPPGGGIQAPGPVNTGMPVAPPAAAAAPSGGGDAGGMPGFPLAAGMAGGVGASPIIAAMMSRFGGGGMSAGGMPTALGGMLPGAK